MAAVSITNVAAAHAILSSGYERRLFTCTATSGGTVDASAYFESIYESKASLTATGVDVEIFGDSAYANTLTFHTTTGACYLWLEGKPIKSSGGST